MKRGTLIGVVVVGLLVVLGGSCVMSYNRLVALDQSVQAQWGQVENVYQRRADLIPNLVETVKGAANFEKETLIAVTEARAKVGQVSVGRDVVNDPAPFQKFQQAQDGLSGALSRLLVVAEKYPELTATAGFRDLQAQLEGAENRVTTERMRFNEAAQAFNTKRNSFPTVLIAGLFGSKFNEKHFSPARAGADQAPKVKFWGGPCRAFGPGSRPSSRWRSHRPAGRPRPRRPSRRRRPAG